MLVRSTLVLKDNKKFLLVFEALNTLEGTGRWIAFPSSGGAGGPGRPRGPAAPGGP